MMKQGWLAKKIGCFAITGCFIGMLSPAFADDSLKTYLLNLGTALGYDLKKIPKPKTANNSLFNASTQNVIQESDLLLSLGTVLMSPIVGQNVIYSLSSINTSVDKLFQDYNTVSSTNTDSNSIYVSPLIDQLPYEQDPINQSLLDMLTTPDSSFCLMLLPKKSPKGIMLSPEEGKSQEEITSMGYLQNKCKDSLMQSNIGVNVLRGINGKVPGPISIADPTEHKILKQLNSNSLTAPLFYSKNNSQGLTQPDQNNTHPGLTAESQAQEAENFIRYASGLVAPVPQTTLDVYKSLYNQVNDNHLGDEPLTEVEQRFLTRTKAQQALSNYLATKRAVAAQMSVGMANLYDMLAKRMPQPENTGTSSRALNEYYMATRRMNDPSQSQNQQWVNLINSASPATVQKEMALLLSEINYQLYLSRQQQERLILTNTMLLFQLGRYTQPLPLQKISD